MNNFSEKKKERTTTKRSKRWKGIHKVQGESEVVRTMK